MNPNPACRTPGRYPTVNVGNKTLFFAGTFRDCICAITRKYLSSNFQDTILTRNDMDVVMVLTPSIESAARDSVSIVEGEVVCAALCVND